MSSWDIGIHPWQSLSRLVPGLLKDYGNVMLSLPFKHLGLPIDPPVLDRLMSQSARHSFPSRVLPALGHVLLLGVVNDQRGPIVSVRSL